MTIEQLISYESLNAPLWAWTEQVKKPRRRFRAKGYGRKRKSVSKMVHIPDKEDY